jgi:hypothetical protein
MVHYSNCRQQNNPRLLDKRPYQRRAQASSPPLQYQQSPSRSAVEPTQSSVQHAQSTIRYTGRERLPIETLAFCYIHGLAKSLPHLTITTTESYHSRLDWCAVV